MADRVELSFAPFANRFCRAQPACYPHLARRRYRAWHYAAEAAFLV